MTRPTYDNESFNLPFFSGFYHSIHDHALDHAIESYMEWRQESPHYSDDPAHFITEDEAAHIWDELYTHPKYEFDYDAYCEGYLNAFCSEFDLDLEYAGKSSPRFYNYSTDKILVTLKDPADARKLKAYAYSPDNRDAWNDCLKANCTSYSGFHSYYDNSGDSPEWRKCVSLYEPAQITLLLAFYIHNETGSESPDMDVYDYMCSSVADDACSSVYDAIAEILSTYRAEQIPIVQGEPLAFCHRCPDTPDLFN